MNELREELSKVSKVVPRGSHAVVAKIIGISSEYLYQIRAGKNLTSEKDGNRELLESINHAYRVIIKNRIKVLKSAL